MRRKAERLRRVCQDGNLAFEVVSMERNGDEGVYDGDAEFPVLWFISKLGIAGERCIPQ